MELAVNVRIKCGPPAAQLNVLGFALRDLALFNSRHSSSGGCGVVDDCELASVSSCLLEG